MPKLSGRSTELPFSWTRQCADAKPWYDCRPSSRMGQLKNRGPRGNKFKGITRDREHYSQGNHFDMRNPVLRERCVQKHR